MMFRPQQKKTNEELYEEYIREVAKNYEDKCWDGWGGSDEHIEIAKKLHPYEEFALT